MKISQDHQHSNRTIYGIKNDTARYTWAGYFLFVLASSMIGDTIILITSIKYRVFKLHKMIVTIIKHIAICDLLVTVTSQFPTFVSLVRNEWVFGGPSVLPKALHWLLLRWDEYASDLCYDNQQATPSKISTPI